MKAVSTFALKFMAICLFFIIFQTCKKDLIIPETEREGFARQNFSINSIGNLYKVSTLVSGVNSNGLSKLQSPYRICSATVGSMYVSAPNAGELIYKISQGGNVSRQPNVPNTYGIKAGENGIIYLLRIISTRTAPFNTGSIIKLDKIKLLLNCRLA